MKLKKGLLAFDQPDDPKAAVAIEDFLCGMRLSRDALADGSWFKLIQLLHPEFAATNIKGKTKKAKEDRARQIITAIVFQRMIDLGAKPVYKTAKKGKKNVKR